jgi:hypothetical protein
MVLCKQRNCRHAMWRTLFTETAHRGVGQFKCEGMRALAGDVPGRRWQHSRVTRRRTLPRCRSRRSRLDCLTQRAQNSLIVVREMIFIALAQPPPAAPQAWAAQRHPTLCREDDLLIRAASDYVDVGVPVWSLIHQAVDQQGPRTRSDRRRLTAGVLCRLRCLLRSRVLVRDGNRGASAGWRLFLVP